MMMFNSLIQSSITFHRALFAFGALCFSDALFHLIKKFYLVALSTVPVCKFFTLKIIIAHCIMDSAKCQKDKDKKEKSLS